MTPDQVIGVGIVFRDLNGQPVGSSAQNIEACFSPSIAEAVAILRGLRFVVDAGLLPIVLESDTKWVVDLVNSDNKSNSDIGIIVKDILVLARKFNISVSFVPRYANTAAHLLVKFALKSTVEWFWLEECPPCLEYVVLLEAITNRFRNTLSGVISETQCVFILGRLISDNTIVGFECLHRLKRSKRKRGSMAIKLDMSKAYDRV
ncbi:hypothetical protein Ddye_025925 [Dipteronia dyeriana]|uniref:RNase H type-1 domain-containing protein n=1 Tax=Dipteronia dyeriana TaxID=168575 RepID=A0AAD9WQ20_9ROSI|nr:hypothetical protein Ddye_025925 [Dipteronia dyeriana]